MAIKSPNISGQADAVSWWAGVICLAVLFWGAMNFTSRNMGGAGVQVPYNTFVWLTAVLFLMLALARIFILRKVSVHPSSLYYVMTLVCLFVPLAYTDRLFLDVEGLRILGILGGVLFFFALQQFFTDGFDSVALWILLISTMIQTLWGLVQYYFIFDASWIFWTAGVGSPYGVFQQVNVFSIYVALGSMLVLHRFFESTQRSWCLQLGVAILIFANAHLAVLSGADTARVVGFLSALIYLSYLWHQDPGVKKPLLLFAFALALGTFLPKSFFDVRPIMSAETTPLAGQISDMALSSSVMGEAGAAVAQTGMERFDLPPSLGTRPTIYKVSFDMFMDEPWTGHGIGSFRKKYLIYQGKYLEKHPAAPAEFNLGHPHNEPLYWMVEMGALPALGFILLIVGWVVGVRARTLDAGVLLVGAPLILQSLLELPFYHSASHYLSFLVILVASMRRREIKEFSVPIWSFILTGPVSLFLAVKAAVFLLSTYYALSMFLLFNASGRDDVTYLLGVNNPSAFKLRYEFELFNWHLRQARRSGEIDLETLNNYLKWAFSTIQYAPMESTYENFIGSLMLIGNFEPARRYLDEALLMYPNNSKLRTISHKLTLIEEENHQSQN